MIEENFNSSELNNVNSDENVIPRVQLIFLCVFFGLFGVSLYYIISRWSNGIRCQILEYFSAVLLIFIISHTLFLSNWLSIIHFSKEIKYVELFGNLFYILGNGLFLLLLLIIGQGWTNSTQYGINVFQRILNYLITLSMIGLSWTIYIMFVFDISNGNNNNNNNNNQYIYYLDTTPGYILVSLYGVIVGFFLFSNHLYYRDEIDGSKKKLIFIFSVIFLNWFLLHPIVIIVAHFIDPYIKYRVVTILNLLINTIFFMVLMFLFRPKYNHNHGHFLSQFFGNNNGIDDDDDEEEEEEEDADDYNVASGSNNNKNEKKPLIQKNDSTPTIEISQ
ncbi:hypothetical protein RB653_000954 [Dictyostelium firmibasis]|uniref:GPR180/TMEM145 transmembrane domain-containing protein n=1 Tax=Dictyostelium firmibasis TaxID=79012 RepID=A0AAN7YYB5_9MYCE